MDALLHFSTANTSRLAVCYHNNVFMQCSVVVALHLRYSQRLRYRLGEEVDNSRCASSIYDRLEVFRNRYRSDCHNRGGSVCYRELHMVLSKVVPANGTSIHLRKTLGTFGRSFVSEGVKFGIK